MNSKLLGFLILICVGLVFSEKAILTRKRSFSDQTVLRYLTERICWWNEICKEEFQTQFRCKCPNWSFCRSPGRYYNAYCSMERTGYIWMQPDKEWTVAS